MKPAERLFSLLRMGFQIIDVNALSPERITEIGKTREKIAFVFRSEAQVLATALSQEMKKQLIDILALELSPEGRRIAVENASNGLPKVSDLDLSQPGAVFEADQYPATYIPGFTVGRVAPSGGYYDSHGNYRGGGGDGYYSGGAH